MTRKELFGSPTAIVAFAFSAAASALPTLGSHPVATIMMIVIGLGLTAVTIDTGSHLMLIMTAAFLMFSLGFALADFGLNGAVPWALLGVAGLVYADIVRLCFAERRHGVIEGGVYQGIGVGVVIVGVGSAATAAALAGLSTVGANANWLLVPLALVLAVVGLVGLAIGVSRSPGQFDKRRWKPGERLTAPPRAASDDPSLKSSMPPAPPPPGPR